MNLPLAKYLQQDGFAGYAYAYPHKTSYRKLSPTISVADAWRSEPKDALFLYVHLPFCEVRCGFCNLFTTVQPNDEFVATTLDAISRQSRLVANAIAPRRISQLAFGGGTPSYLSLSELQRLFEELSNSWPIEWNDCQSSFEVSPATISCEKLSFLRSQQVDRISMGVQSFSEADLKQLGRPQAKQDVEIAIDRIKTAGFPVFNLDLIYGIEGQTESSWMETIERTIEIDTEEVFLYPLYVRELTGLGKAGKTPTEHRRTLYQMARSALLDAGYQQCSMRLFRKRELKSTTDYCCQEDGMIGLGPGARSYTRELHYSSEYAVGRSGVKQIIAQFNQQLDEEMTEIDYGTRLSTDEQQRRYLIKSLLHFEGLDRERYRQRFGSDVMSDFSELSELIEMGLGVLSEESLRLTPEGMSWSDVIGPWLYSDIVKMRMEKFELI